MVLAPQWPHMLSDFQGADGAAWDSNGQRMGRVYGEGSTSGGLLRGSSAAGATAAEAGRVHGEQRVGGAGLGRGLSRELNLPRVPPVGPAVQGTTRRGEAADTAQGEQPRRQEQQQHSQHTVSDYPRCSGYELQVSCQHVSLYDATFAVANSGACNLLMQHHLHPFARHRVYATSYRPAPTCLSRRV